MCFVNLFGDGNVIWFVWFGKRFCDEGIFCLFEIWLCVVLFLLFFVILNKKNIIYISVYEFKKMKERVKKYYFF